jgi:hypothetical protein
MRLEAFIGMFFVGLMLIWWAAVVGPVLGGDQTTPATGRQAKTGEANVQQTHGKYFEAASRGVLAFACDQGAGVAVNTTISTTAMFSLYNPAAAKIRIAIKKVSIAYFSGTLGAGVMYHAVNPIISGTANPTAPTSGTLLTSYWTDVFNQSLGTPQGIARTGSTVVAPIVLRPITSMFAELASTTNGFQVVTDDVDGEIVLESGGIYQVQAVAAAGSTPKVTIGVIWEEVPYVASVG